MPKGNCSEDILSLFGIKKVLGYVIDEKNSDIILIGGIDNTLPQLYLEDLIIALKNTWLFFADLKGNTYYYSAPGYSIDPDPRVLNQLQQISGEMLGNSDIERTSSVISLKGSELWEYLLIHNLQRLW